MANSGTADRGWPVWQRRILEGMVAILAFAIWGKLAYVGGFRILARMDGMSLGGLWIIDVLSLTIGVSGSIAGASALGALVMRLIGRTPKSLMGAPDDSPEDYPQRVRSGDTASI